MTTQDITKGVDFTIAGTVVNASTLNQHVDLARMASDKGLIIETVDTALDTPVVPNPDGNYSGIIPTWWKRYIWRRKGFTNIVILYVWDESGTLDPTLLYWRTLNEDTSALASDVSDALNLANQALVSANNAAALTDINTAQLATANNDIAVNTIQINNLQAEITQLSQNQSQGLFRTGDIRYTFSAEQFSLTEDAGWLLLNGDSVSKTVFAALFAILQPFVTLDGLNNFFLPDCRGRGGIGAGLGDGLTNRVLGSMGGSENVSLTAEQCASNHQHDLGVEASTGPAGTAPSKFASGGGEFGYQFGTAAAVVGKTEPFVQAATPHNNMQPFFACNILIKT